MRWIDLAVALMVLGCLFWITTWPQPTVQEPRPMEVTRSGDRVVINQEGFRVITMRASQVAGTVQYPPRSGINDLDHVVLYVRLGAGVYRLDCQSAEDAQAITDATFDQFD